MTATLSGASAIVRELYPKGKLPQALYMKHPLENMTQKTTDFVGDTWRVALQTEDNQGVSAGFNDAQNALQAGSYSKFSVTRFSYYGIARVTGEAMKAAVMDEGALIDLWQNEIDGVTRTVGRMKAVHAYGAGTGYIGQIASTATVSSTTVALAVPEEINRFSVGMKIQLVNSGTLRNSGAAIAISGVDRLNGTISFASALNGTITAAAASDYIVRAGDLNSVPYGLASWIEGGSSPSALYGLTRTTDPVRLAGLSKSFASTPMDEALLDIYGALETESDADTDPGVFFVHTKKLAKFKKLLEGKVQYTRTTMSGNAGIGFKAIEFEGSNGVVRIVGDRNSPYKDGIAMDMKHWMERSLGPAPQILDFDENQFLRNSNADSYEVRVGMYYSKACNNPSRFYRAQNFGE